MKVWVTRDDNGDGQQMNIWDGDIAKPNVADGEFFGDKTPILWMSAFDFKDLFGFTPRKGSCKQYELSLKEIT